MNQLLVLLGAAVIPMIIGAIWYGPLFGKAWMSANGFTEDYLQKNGNMGLIFGLSFVLSIVLAFGLSGMTNHQSAIDQLFLMHPEYAVQGSEVNTLVTTIMDNYGERHRTFGHGAVHGVIAAILIALPLILINGLFERKTWKLMGIHIGYWVVTLALMGGVVCQWF